MSSRAVSAARVAARSVSAGDRGSMRSAFRGGAVATRRSGAPSGEADRAVPKRVELANSTQSSFAASVLQGRDSPGRGARVRNATDRKVDPGSAGPSDSRRQWRSSRGRDKGNGNDAWNKDKEWRGQGGGRGNGERNTRRGEDVARSQKNRDWFSSASRVQAMEQVANARQVATWGDVKETEKAEVEDKVLFGGGDFGSLAQHVPKRHWVAPFFGEITSALEVNAAISAKEKQRILGETVHALVSFGLSEPKGAFVTGVEDISDRHKHLKVEEGMKTAEIVGEIATGLGVDEVEDEFETLTDVGRMKMGA